MDIETRKKIMKDLLRSSPNLDIGDKIDKGEYKRLLKEKNDNLLLYRYDYFNKISFDDEDSIELIPPQSVTTYMKICIDSEYIQYLFNIQIYKNTTKIIKYTHFVYLIIMLVILFLIFIWVMSIV